MIRSNYLIIILIIFILITRQFAQGILEINGKVGDHLGNPLINANVTVVNTYHGTAADEDGKYLITLPISFQDKQIIIEVKYVGYLTKSVQVNLTKNLNVIDFILERDEILLKPVIVSAQRREEYLQNVPISISTFDDTQIRDRGINRMFDLQKSVPNFFFGDGTLNLLAVSSIRGIAGYARASGVEKRANYYIDDVYMGRSISIGLDLIDLERIEILKGPQGTLFGKNTVSGAINITTRKPVNDLEASISAEAGNLNYFSSNLILNLPLIENILFTRLSAKFQRRDGYITNLYNNKDMNRLNILVGRIQLRYLPSPNLDIIFSISGNRDNRDPRSIAIPIEDPAYSFAPGPREVSTEYYEYEKRRLFGSRLSMDYQIKNNYSLKSITAYKNSKYNHTLDHDMMPIFWTNEVEEIKDYHFTQEFRISSPLFDKYNFVSGIFYLYQNSDLYLRAWDSSENPYTPNGITIMDGPVSTSSLGWYLHGNYQLSNTLFLFGGIRYTYEYKTIKYNQFNDPPIFINLENYKDTYSKGVFSPQAGIKYKPVNDLLLYAKTSWGYKSGGWGNFLVKVIENIKLKPEYSISYEAGFKLNAFDNLIILNSALFLGKFDDYQTEIWIPIEGMNFPSYTNAARVTTKGIELDLTFSPISNLSIDGSMGYVNTNYDEFNSPAPGTNNSGNRLELAPELDYGLSAVYLLPIKDIGTFSFRGDFIYKGDYYWDPSNTKDFYVEPYNLLDARIGYESPTKIIEIYIWGRNLTDELYMLVKSKLPLFKYAWYGLPRTFGIEAKYNFLSN